MTDTTHIPTHAVALLDQGKKIAIATVIDTWGSAPRAIGSQLLVVDDGVFYGSVSGGCVEGAVILEAQAAIQDGQCRRLEYGVADDDAFAVGLACGGTIQIIVEPVGVPGGMPVAQLCAMAAAWGARTPIGVRTHLGTWDRKDLDASQVTSQAAGLHGDDYLHIQAPPLQLIVVGAVHIAQFLTPMARSLGYQVVVVDPRESFASRTRFAHETLIVDWPEGAIAALTLDAQTAVVTLTHDPKMDGPALEAALASPAFYIGALGSTRTHAKRCAALLDAGFSQDQIDRISGPVGLDIGAKGPSEIAVSILAEILQMWRAAA